MSGAQGLGLKMDWLATLLVTFYMLKSAWAIGNGVVLPNDPYIYIGNNLTLMCNLTRFDTDYHSQFLTFSRHNDEVLPSQYIEVTGTRSIVLRYPVYSSEDRGNYICKLNRTSGRPEIIGNQFVNVEYEPRPVTEINCCVYNWENMTCSWDLGVEFVSPETIDIKLIWTIRGDQFECPHQTMTTCSWWAVDGADSFLSDMIYMMGVTITDTRTGEMFPLQTKAVKVDTSKIVEPSPVIELMGESNSTCVTINWKHLKVSRDKVYQVQFKADREPTWKTKHVGSEEMFTQCDLLPNTIYLFNVTCKPRIMGKVRGFWSQENVIRIKTKEGIPTEAPRIAAGSYIEQPCPQNYPCKKVQLFWQPLDPSSSSGKVVRYRLDYKNMDTDQAWESQSEAGNNYEGMLLLMHGNSYIIQLRAATRVGVSRVFSQILLPPKHQRPSVPEFIVEGHNESHSTIVTVRWTLPRVWTSQFWQNLTSYTVFWCRGSRISLSCQDAIQWREVPVSATSTELLVDALDTYLFSVAVNALSWSGETISSGIQWNSCIYMKNLKPEHAPSNVRLLSYQPDLGLSIEWDRLTCGETHAYIQHYIVNICPSSHGSNCTGAHTTFLLENTASHYTLKGLRCDGRYKVWITAIGEGGVSPDSEVLFGVVVDRSLKPGEITGIVIGALFVIIIFLFGIILCTRRVYRVVKQRYFEPVPIEIPSTLPPLPPIPMPPRQSSHDSDSSDTIYEKIDGPPSPSSSTDSNTGVEAPLINHRWKLANLKNHIYGSRKQQRDSNDSGRGSLSHSADTLLMRLHPSHLRKSKNKKNKEKNKSESDSGVITDSQSCGRGQVAVAYQNGQSNVIAYNNTQSNSGFQEHGQNDYQSHSCMCTTTDQSNSVVYHSNQVCLEDSYQHRKHTGDVNPYSCVNIVDQINSASEKLKRKISEGALTYQFGDESSGVKQSTNGSTLSLPQFCHKGTGLLSTTLDFRTKSADNKLDFEERKLSCMSETKEYESSDAYSEDGTLDSVGDVEHETSSGSSGSSTQPAMTSYIHFKDGETLEPCSDKTKSAIPSFNVKHDCHCKSKVPELTPDGYLTEAAMNQTVCMCAKNEQLYKNDGLLEGCQTADLIQDAEIIKSSLRPVSQVVNLPPHFFGSMSRVPVDPSNTTEL